MSAERIKLKNFDQDPHISARKL